MVLFGRALLVLTVSLGLASAALAAKVRLPRDYGAWSRVAMCESGGWRVLGWAYPDSLGITRTNYLAFGGKPIKPGRVSRREVVAQIRVADRLVRHYGVSIPDQYGCAAW